MIAVAALIGLAVTAILGAILWLLFKKCYWKGRRKEGRRA